MPRHSERSKRITRMTDKKRQAMELRLAGLNNAEIGERLGVTGQRISQIIHECLAEYRQDIAADTESVRSIELERLDRLWEVQYALALSGQRGAGVAVERCLAIMDRRAKLLGLDSPAKVETRNLTVHVDATQEMTDAHNQERSAAILNALVEAGVVPAPKLELVEGAQSA